MSARSPESECSCVKAHHDQDKRIQKLKKENNFLVWLMTLAAMTLISILLLHLVARIWKGPEPPTPPRESFWDVILPLLGEA